jgi:pyridoxamine 5'-phosphate oxidase-like protein
VPAPKRDRPQLPKGYIKTTPKGMLTWPAAKKILTTFPYLWIATTDDDGAPHLVQQWGVWIDDTLYFEGSDRTRWARNLARDPRLSFGANVADQAVYGQARVDIVRGGVDHPTAVKIARQYAAKYGKKFKYRPKPEQYEKGHVFRARPTKLIAFDVRRFETSAARFTFETAAR